MGKMIQFSFWVGFLYDDLKNVQIELICDLISGLIRACINRIGMFIVYLFDDNADGSYCGEYCGISCCNDYLGGGCYDEYGGNDQLNVFSYRLYCFNIVYKRFIRSIFILVVIIISSIMCINIFYNIINNYIIIFTFGA